MIKKKKCRPGYSGHGTFCYRDCPAGFINHGLYCGKPRAYGRGAGYALWHKNRCRRRHGSCQRVGLMYYPRVMCFFFKFMLATVAIL